jgi:hypothetical protein
MIHQENRKGPVQQTFFMHRPFLGFSQGAIARIDENQLLWRVWFACLVDFHRG